MRRATNEGVTNNIHEHITLPEHNKTINNLHTCITTMIARKTTIIAGAQKMAKTRQLYYMYRAMMLTLISYISLTVSATNFKVKAP